jgi:hypothetical protein
MKSEEINRLSITELKEHYVRKHIAYFSIEHQEKFLFFYCDGSVHLTDKGSDILDFLHMMVGASIDCGEGYDINNMFWKIYDFVLDFRYNGVDIDFRSEKHSDLEAILGVA